MRPRCKSPTCLLPLLAMTTLALVYSQACARRGRPDAAGIPPAREPDQYSATVVRIVDDGQRREVSITREYRSGEMRREEWTEQGRNRALIWGTQLKNGLLLDIDAQSYADVEIVPSAAQARQTNGGGSPVQPRSETVATEEGALQAIDRAFDEAQSPDRVEARQLPDEVIDGHRCSVYEQRARFADGHTEITKSYRATDLSGLALRTETSSEPGAIKVITERRDVRTEVPAGAFVVPANYKKLPR